MNRDVAPAVTRRSSVDPMLNGVSLLSPGPVAPAGADD